MSVTRVIRKQNMITWSHQQLSMLVAKSRAENKTVPPVILDTIQKLAYFGGKAYWADFQSDPKSREWLHDLDLIDDIRAALITRPDSFMRKEASEKHLFDEDFYNVIEAMLLGFAEQWPTNEFTQMRDIHAPGADSIAVSRVENKSSENETVSLPGAASCVTYQEPPMIFTPMCGVSNYSLTTLTEAVYRQKEIAFAFLTLQGKQIDDTYFRDVCLEKKEDLHLDLNKIPDRSQFPFLPRDNRNFNGGKSLVGFTPEEKLWIEEKGFLAYVIFVMIAVLVAPFALAIAMIYMPPTAISGLLLCSMILSMSAFGVFIAPKIESMCVNTALKIAAYFKTPYAKENPKISELFNTLNTHPNQGISKINPVLSTTVKLGCSLSQEQREKRAGWLDKMTAASEPKELKSPTPLPSAQPPVLVKTPPKPRKPSNLQVQREAWLGHFKAPTSLENQRLEEARINHAVNRRGCHIL